jgi:large subunit ribosomal protein L21
MIAGSRFLGKCRALCGCDIRAKLLLELVMYAVVKTGGKQYKVVVGEKLKVEQITADVDSQIVLNEVLMVADGDAVAIGAPLVAGASIKATIVSHGRGEKVRIFKMRRRKHYQKRQGHRQNYTEIRIDEIVK